jgi:hypothetical protein
VSDQDDQDDQDDLLVMPITRITLRQQQELLTKAIKWIDIASTEYRRYNYPKANAAAIIAQAAATAALAARS